jgi:hypothetical protein
VHFHDVSVFGILFHFLGRMTAVPTKYQKYPH